MQGVHEAQTQTATDDGGSPAPSSPGLARRRPLLLRWSKMRAPVGLAALLALPVTVVLLDLGRRSDRVFAFEGDYRLTYLAAMLESSVLWGVLLYAACRQRGALRYVAAVLFAVFGTFAIGGQTYFF